MYCQGNTRAVEQEESLLQEITVALVQCQESERGGGDGELGATAVTV